MAQTWERSKDPDEVVDYGVNWAPDIGANTIVTSTWVIGSGHVSVVSDTHSSTTTTVRLSSGTVGESAALINHVVLSNGEEMDQTCTLKIKAR